MKINVRRAVSALLAGVLFVGATVVPSIKAAPEEEQTPMVLRYTTPASSLYNDKKWTAGNDAWDHAIWERATLPIGNGILGANVYGELKNEVLTVNEETLWSGGRNSVTDYTGGNPTGDMSSIYWNYANTLTSGGSLSDIENLKGKGSSECGYNYGYQPLGNLNLTFASAPSSVPKSYVRTLNLDDGEATVSYNSVKRTYFASNPDNVIVSRIEGDTGNITVGFTTKQTASVSASVSGGIGYLEIAGTVTNNQLLHNTQVAVVPEGGSVSVSGNTLVVSGASAVTIYLTAATDYKNVFYNDDQSIRYYYRNGKTAAQLSSDVRSVLTSAVNKGYTAVRNDHQADYHNLYNRVSLNLGQTATSITTDTLLSNYSKSGTSAAEKRYLEVLMYQYGRYLLISASRENSQLPTNLQGIWNEKNEAAWCSDIHTNINEQMNYWLSSNCNLTECAIPLVNYVANLKIPGGITVKTYTGSDHGIMAHTQNTPFCYTAPGWVIQTWGWSPAAATWLMQNCFDYYEFSGDLDTLRNVIYPMLKEQVLMYEDLLISYNGRKVMPITLSPEIGPITAGNTYEQSLIWQLYSDTIEAANLLGEDAAQIAAWQSTMDQLNPIMIGTSGQVKEWYTETSINSIEDTRSHRHLSNLLGLYPGNLFDTEEELAAAKVSLNNKNFGRVGQTSNNPEGGWTYAQLINTWARLGDGANAYFSVSQLLKNKVYKNLFDWHKGGDYGHFQIDGNYGYSAGVGEMLLQSNLGYLNLLPAIPNEWATGSVKGLLGEGGFEVSMNWENKTLVNGSIHSKNGGECSVKLPADMNVVDASGNVVAASGASETIVTFQSVQGETYTLSSCTHSSTTVTGKLDATCTTAGYTGDTVCASCGVVISSGSVIPATGHQHTTTVNAKAPTCTEPGYTGDTKCVDCGEILAQGTVIPAKGHTFVNGFCTVCGAQDPDFQQPEIPEGLVLVSAKKALPQKIKILGTFTDFENVDSYGLTSHGLLYIKTETLGSNALEVNTPGRTKVVMGKFTEDGSWSFTMNPAGTSVSYTLRAFVTWTDRNGNTHYEYSEPMVVTSGSLSY